VLSVEYRKCLFGVHHPVPSDDVLAAWRWAVAHAAELGVGPARLHLGGASAGACLAGVVTKRLRDGAGTRPASLVLVYPTLHPELPPPSDELRVAVASALDEGPGILRALSLNYAGTEAAFGDPYAFPSVGDVADQPPVYVLNSETDILRASGEAYAAQLEVAGVAVTVDFEPGTNHGHLNEPENPGARRSIERITRWLASR
jgi:acetyl esterase/lipase